MNLGEVGCGDAGLDWRVGEVLVDVWSGGGSGFGTNITDAKLSSESTLVSLCKLLSLEESEPSSLECLLSHSLLSSTASFVVSVGHVGGGGGGAGCGIGVTTSPPVQP